MTLPRRLRPTPEQRLRTLTRQAMPGLAAGLSRSLRPVTHGSNPGIVLPDTPSSPSISAAIVLDCGMIPFTNGQIPFTVNEALSSGDYGSYWQLNDAGTLVSYLKSGWYQVWASAGVPSPASGFAVRATLTSPGAIWNGTDVTIGEMDALAPQAISPPYEVSDPDPSSGYGLFLRSSSTADSILYAEMHIVRFV